MIHLTTYACNVCDGTACEVSTEDMTRPQGCPYGHIAFWRRGDE